MAKKTTPAWQIQGLSGPPPVVRGYHHYEVQPGPRESLREHWGTALWSLRYWGKKVRQDIHVVRERGERGTLTARTLDRVALAAIWMLGTDRPKG